MYVQKQQDVLTPTPLHLDTDSDPVYISAGFFPGDSGAGRHFSISYKNITLATPSDPGTLGTENLFQTINANNNWLRFPVVFVGAERADYSSASSPDQLEADYQFWFIFLREKLVTDDVIYSRLARVCRNDPGSTLTSNGAPYFTTFMKARIFCERSKPPSFDSIHTLDYEYNSISESNTLLSIVRVEIFYSPMQPAMCLVRMAATTVTVPLQRDYSMDLLPDQGMGGKSKILTLNFFDLSPHQ